MKPLMLAPYHKSVRTLANVGPKTAEALGRLCGGESIIDLLLHRPVDGIMRGEVIPVSKAIPGRIATVKVTSASITPSPRRGVPHRIRVEDESGEMALIYFKGAKNWIEKTYAPGQTLTISGMVEERQGVLQMTHPDFVVGEGEENSIPAFQPVYPLTQGVSMKVLLKAMQAALSETAQVKDWPEWIDGPLRQTQKWPTFHDALTAIHTPERMADIGPDSPARKRLAYDELMAAQLAIQVIGQHHKKQTGTAFAFDSAMRGKALSALPFELTQGQKSALSEIDADMQSEHKMLRLIQGDVGSGKTVIAMLAGLNAIACNTQAALMAPTEILARQHYEGLSPLLESLGIACVLLTGADKGKVREDKLNHIANGDAPFVIGTHALFQDAVDFQRLGLAVIDEQHRFGVHQRLSLSAKHPHADMLVMTATPIPRTLSLAAYGHMDLSQIHGKPPGRKEIETRLMSADRIAELVDGLGRKIQQGEQIYWVCPLIEETETSDMAAGTERAELLAKLYPGRVALIHGRMKPKEKEAIMEGFINGDTAILVATTVIEVGVNVPNASVMVIEHAERFGLAQLHQLRGRVGRGDVQSSCILMYHGALSETAKERLQIMRQSNDGFVIAEKDLDLRGAGEMLGTRQSGLPQFKMADLVNDRELLSMAAQDCRLLLQKDPSLTSKRGEAARLLLYLYRKDAAVKTIRSG